MVELVEAIFLEIPPNQIMTNVQGVSRRWKTIVEISTPIQQALFFKPFPDKPTGYHVTAKTIWTAGPEGRKPVKFLQHDLLAMIVYRPGSLARAQAAIAHPRASWRRQLLTQPPIALCMEHIVEVDDDGEPVHTYEGIGGIDNMVRLGTVLGRHARCLSDFDPECIVGWKQWLYNDRVHASASQVLSMIKKMT